MSRRARKTRERRPVEDRAAVVDLIVVRCRERALWATGLSASRLPGLVGFKAGSLGLRSPWIAARWDLLLWSASGMLETFTYRVPTRGRWEWTP